MAEVAPTPVAATVPAVDAKKENVKPEKPDEEVYKASLKKAEKEHEESMKRFNAVKAKLDLAQPKSKDSPTAKRRSDLLDQIKEIRGKQSTGKAGRTQKFEQIKKEDEKLKALIAEQKVARSRVSFKNVDEIDREIDRLDKQVNGGMMKLVDEKKALADISSLRKQRKGFAAFDEQQKKIDEAKAKLKTLRDDLDDPESKALSEKYNNIQTELDTIKAEQDDAYKNINALRDERTKVNDEQKVKFNAIRKIKDDYYQANRAIQEHEYQARKRARERKQNERETFEKEKRKERAQKMLAEAGDKAYLDEIRCSESFLRWADPSYSVEKAPLQAPSQFTATAQRTVDDAGIKGMKVVQKKDEEDYFAGTGGKKGKKGRKNAAAAESPAVTPSAKYNCPPSVIENCEFLKVDPPMSAADIPGVVEKVKAKLNHWKADQDAQTARNVEKAKKEVDRLEAEETTSSAPGTPAHTNGDSKASAPIKENGTSPSVNTDIAKDLKETSLEDKE